MEILSTVDNIKKGRILALSLVIAISILILKITQTTAVVDSGTVLMRGVGYFIFSYVGLIWALKFQVTLHTLLYVIPQSSLFIFAEVMFLEFFFFRRIGRIYEIIILFVLLTLLFMSTYISFLSTNVFNVSTIKEVPLINAARTVSFIASLVSIFLITIGLFDSGFHVLIIWLMLLTYYISIVYLHLKHMDLQSGRIGGYTYITVLLMMIILVTTSFVSQRHEMIAIAVTLGGYLALNTAFLKAKNMYRSVEFLKSVLLIIFVLIINYFWK